MSKHDDQIDVKPGWDEKFSLQLPPSKNYKWPLVFSLGLALFICGCGETEPTIFPDAKGVIKGQTLTSNNQIKLTIKSISDVPDGVPKSLMLTFKNVTSQPINFETPIKSYLRVSKEDQKVRASMTILTGDKDGIEKLPLWLFIDIDSVEIPKTNIVTILPGNSWTTEFSTKNLCAYASCGLLGMFSIYDSSGDTLGKIKAEYSSNNICIESNVISYKFGVSKVTNKYIKQFEKISKITPK